MCWEKVREGGEEGEVTCCSRVSNSQKQSAPEVGGGEENREDTLYTRMLEPLILTLAYITSLMSTVSLNIVHIQPFHNTYIIPLCM